MASSMQSPGKLACRASVGAALLLLVCVHAATYFLGFHEMWATPITLIAITVTAGYIQALVSPAGMFCWPNVFVGVLSLFHLGYYLPARMGFIDELPFMPPVAGATAATAMALYVAAVLAFVAGAVAASVMGAPQKIPTPEFDREAQVLFVSGILLSVTGLVLIAVFLAQVGGPLILLQMSYEEIFSFLAGNDPRFALTGLGVLPTGLLLCYAAACVDPWSKDRVAWITTTLWTVAVVQIVLGSRGSALLSLLGWMYLRHHLQKKWRAFPLALLVSAILLVIPVVRNYRNLSWEQRWRTEQPTAFSPLAAIVEMGLTYRPLYGITDIFANDVDRLLLGESYRQAVWHLVPNLARDSAAVPAEYFRTAVWINEQLDPISAARNIGMGSSGIGEPYANFAYPGIVAAFLLLGSCTAFVERRALASRNPRAFGYVAIMFVPLCWYVRDDVFSTLRAIIWPIAVVTCVRAVLRALCFARPRSPAAALNLARE